MSFMENRGDNNIFKYEYLAEACPCAVRACRELVRVDRLMRIAEL